MLSVKKYMRVCRGLVALLCFAAVMAEATTARAEVRMYTLVRTRLLDLSHTSTIDIFLKQENRFRESGLVLNKVFVGLKPKIRPWLSVQIYYANKDLNYTRHLNKHMVVGDIILSTRLGSFAIKNRNGNEWHITDHFYRYRNYSAFAWSTPVGWLTLWTAEEWRFDSDQSRVNMNDIRLGIALGLRKRLNSKIFFDLESKRRNSVSWRENPFLGMELMATL